MSGNSVPKTYCAAPFSHIYSDNRGRYRLCCYSNPLKGSEKFTSNKVLPFDYFRSMEMQEVRSRMWQGERIPACSPCYAIEEAGSLSPRITEHRSDAHVYHTVCNVGIKLRVFGSQCNLGCYMCLPHNSSTRRRELNAAGLEDFWPRPAGQGSQLSYSQYRRIVENLLANIDCVSAIKITGGEPFVLPRHLEFLERIPKARARHIKLSYDTNLTVLHENWSILKGLVGRFGVVKLAVSCDHYGDKLAWIRHPINVPIFESNLMRAKPWISKLHCTVSILNVFDLPEIVSYYWQKFGLRIAMSSVVSRPEMLSIKNICDKERVLSILSDLEGVSGMVHSELLKPCSRSEYEMGLAYVRRLNEYRLAHAINAKSLWPWLYND